VIMPNQIVLNSCQTEKALFQVGQMVRSDPSYHKVESYFGLLMMRINISSNIRVVLLLSVPHWIASKF